MAKFSALKMYGLEDSESTVGIFNYAAVSGLSALPAAEKLDVFRNDSQTGAFLLIRLIRPCVKLKTTFDEDT